MFFFWPKKVICDHTLGGSNMHMHDRQCLYLKVMTSVSSVIHHVSHVDIGVDTLSIDSPNSAWLLKFDFSRIRKIREGLIIFTAHG